MLKGVFFALLFAPRNGYVNYQAEVPTPCQKGVIVQLDPPIVLDKEKQTLPWLPLLLLDDD